MMLMTWIQLLGAFLFFTCTCFAKGGPAEYLEEVLTFNAALLDTTIAKDDNTAIPNNREERRDALIQYLNGQTNADIVCLQEVQFGQDLEKIVNEVSTTFPYSFSELHLPDGTLPPQSTTIFEPACDPAAFSQLIDCASDNGCLTDTRDTAFAGYNCLLTKCEMQFNTLLSTRGEECLSCIGTNSPQNYARLASRAGDIVVITGTKYFHSYISRTLPEGVPPFIPYVTLILCHFQDKTRSESKASSNGKHIAVCAGPPSPILWNINKLGLLLLSKKALYDTAAVEFYPNTLDTFVRGYLQVKAGDNDLTVACVHVTSSTFQIPPLNPQFSTLAEQNEAEIQLLVNALSFVEPLIMLGDFNVGPGTLSINPIQQPAYEELAFFFETRLVREPTLSTGNQYNVGTTAPDTALDHVFVDRRSRIYNVKIICLARTSKLYYVTADSVQYLFFDLSNRVVLKTDDISVAGDLPLSDHYGVEAFIKVRVCLKRRRY